jgi:DNA repair protein RadC
MEKKGSPRNEENKLSEQSNCLQEIQLSYKRKKKFQERFQISNSDEVYQYAQSIWNPNTLEMQESFYVIFLDKRNAILGYLKLAQGGVAGVIVDSRIIFATAVKCLSSSIILLHNHPSGNLTPSQADKNITQKIKNGAKLLDMILLDHLIITVDSFYSFADNNLL